MDDTPVNINVSINDTRPSRSLGAVADRRSGSAGTAATRAVACPSVERRATADEDGCFAVWHALQAAACSILSRPRMPRDIVRSATVGGIGAMNGRMSTDNGGISAEAIDRKLRSERILQAEGVPFFAALPVIETKAEALKRSKEEVALRTLCLLFVAAKGEGLEEELVERLLETYELRPHLTPKELAFVLDNSPSQHDRIQFTWRHEAAWTLLWALGFVAQLGKPDQICDVEFAAKTMAERTTSEFIDDSELRPIADILDQADLIYRYHWAVRNARTKGQQVPAALDPGVTAERHHALNWLIGYGQQTWDHVTTHT
ncbi:hypothetical protein ABID59_001607 [Bradyrhizobium sp. S3.3.6]